MKFNYSHQIIFTNKARCRDCYRCIRFCPVKAIKMIDGQAHVDEKRCIICGNCIRECPQGAKQYRRDTEFAWELIRSGAEVAVSLAPSYPSAFPGDEASKLPAALKKLGFSYVAETATGAYFSAKRTAELFARSGEGAHVCSACPATVNYFEIYASRNVDRLVKALSPMIIHGKILKKKLGENSKVIFIGPCAAKKAEAERSDLAGVIDCVLTFEELREMLSQAEIKFDALEAAPLDDYAPPLARTYPLLGGLLKNAGFDPGEFNSKYITVSGSEEIMEIAQNPESYIEKTLFEPLFCKGGCVGGPGVGVSASIVKLKANLLKHLESQSGAPDAPVCEPEPRELDARFAPRPIPGERQFSEEEIEAALAKAGKAEPSDRLNCGSCGYDSCREKAIAVLSGTAETEMCLPHMRRQAEIKNSTILETSPNGIILLEEDLTISVANEAFKRLFSCSDGVCGKPVSILMDPQPFYDFIASGTDKIESTVSHEKYGIICRQLIYRLPYEKQIVGIFVNITNALSDKSKLDELKRKTIEQAQELLHHQIDMAQNIARLLGESAARGEALVENLITYSREEELKRS